MLRVSLLFLVLCVASVLERSFGNNYYLQTGPGSADLLTYPFFYPPMSAIYQPADCDKKKEGGESSSSSESSSSEEGGSKESGEGSSSESAESGEGGEGSSSESKESGESKEESKSGEESGSSEEGGSKESSESSSEESGEKKKEEKKKEKKYVFPARPYDFPPSNVQQIVYSPVPSYAYMPYKNPYVVQPPVASYPMKNNYQYISVPATARVVSGYSAPAVSRLVNSPITKIVYSSGISYPQMSKSIVSPGARVYSVPGTWNGGLSGYYKK